MNETRLGVAALLAVGCMTVSTQALAVRPYGAVAINYIKGAGEVFDFYKESPSVSSSSGGVPIGTAVRFGIDTEIGLRWDVGFGPYALIRGDFEYTDIPIATSVGWAFNQGGAITPYVRGGVVYHETSGDFVELTEIAQTGVLAAAGIEIGSGRGPVLVEVGFDSTKVRFSDGSRTQEIAPVGLWLSCGWAFR